MDIDKKIKELQGDLERLEAELDSINRANYDGHETKTLMAKEKQIREKQLELLKYKKAKEMASTKDSMEILRLSGYTVDSFLKVWEDDKAIIRQDTNSGLYEVKNKKTGSSKIVKSLEEAQKLYKSSAKDGYKMEDPKEIEAAIKKVKASGHPNPQYLAALERALVVAKQERGMKDSCGEKVFTKGTEDSKFEVMYTIGHFHDPETLRDKKEIIQANSAGEARRMIENKWKGNLDRIIQITQVHDSCGEKIYTKGTDDADLSKISKNWSKATIEHIIKNAHIFKPEVVEEAKRLSKTVKDAEEQWITMNGAHIKVEEGESKESAAKKFISSKGDNKSSSKSESKPKKEISKGVSSEDLELSEEEVSKIKKKFSKIKDPDSDTGSEYGHYVDAMRSQLRKKGKYPDMSELDDIKDKMWYMRQGGKKDTPEYKELEKQKNEWNKNFNKLEKEIKNKAYELSSPNEKKRLDEISSFFKKNPTNMGDSAEDACSTKDSAIQKECNEILKLSGFIS